MWQYGFIGGSKYACLGELLITSDGKPLKSFQCGIYLRHICHRFATTDRGFLKLELWENYSQCFWFLSLWCSPQVCISKQFLCDVNAACWRTMVSEWTNLQNCVIGIYNTLFWIFIVTFALNSNSSCQSSLTVWWRLSQETCDTWGARTSTTIGSLNYYMKQNFFSLPLSKLHICVRYMSIELEHLRLYLLH